MRLLSHCTCCFPSLETLFSTPYSLLPSIAFLLRCPLLQEVLWVPRLLLGASHLCFSISTGGGGLRHLGVPSVQRRVGAEFNERTEYASEDEQVTLFSSLSLSNRDSCPALGIKALTASSVCPWEEKAVDQRASEASSHQLPRVTVSSSLSPANHDITLVAGKWLGGSIYTTESVKHHISRFCFLLFDG